MGNGNPVKTYLSMSELYPGINSDVKTLKDLLQGLSKTDSIIWCSRLNMVLCMSQLSLIDRQVFGINQFLSKDDFERLRILGKQRGDDMPILFFRGQILELIRWIVLYCDDQPNDGSTFEDIETRSRFVKALLIAGDLWAKRVFKMSTEAEMVSDVAGKLGLGQMRKSIEAQVSITEMETIYGRGWSLFCDYLPPFSPTFGDDFRTATGLSVKDFYICLVCFISNFMKPDSPNIFDCNELRTNTEYGDIFGCFL